MTDKSLPPLPQGVLDDEQVAKISGGECSVNDYISILGGLRTTYDQLVDFTSYVIERVANSTR